MPDHHVGMWVACTLFAAVPIQAESKQQTSSSGRFNWQAFNDQFLRVVSTSYFSYHVQVGLL